MWLKSAVIAASLLLYSPAARAQTFPPATIIEKRQLDGLAAPGRIVTDRWGIAHIQAASSRDAFFLQGYSAAHDRLWQIDLWRKRGMGRLSASFGPAFAEQDRASRLFLYRGDMAVEWAAYPTGARGWTEAFVSGINAYIDEIAAGRRPLPVEFGITSSQPERWTADDVVRVRSHALVSNVGAEVARAQSLCLGGLPYEPIRRRLEPPHAISVPKGIDPCDITPAAVKDYLLAVGGVRFEGKTVVAAVNDDARLALANADAANEGSNNWVIDAAHTTTGRPMLANDPHRAHAVPSLRSLVHLDAPDLHLIGAGEPALPGISFGHNDDAAWGITIFPVDQQDLYVYEMAGDGYRYEGTTADFITVTEMLEIKGEAPRPIMLKSTRHGPIVGTDTAKARAFAVRSVWDAPGASGYFNAAWLFRAKRWADFEAAQTHWGTPPLNLVYADRSGDIGWHASGFVPVRPNWDGLVPVSGDGSHEWQGLTPAALLPSVRNPARGWFASANVMNLPKDYPNDTLKISFEWTDRSRIDRIETVLGGRAKVSIADSMALQTDQFSPLAVCGTELLAGLASSDVDTQAGLALLKGWDGHETAESAPAALFEIWSSRHLGRALVEAVVPAATRPAFESPQVAAIIAVLESPAAWRGDAGSAQRDAILAGSLADAVREARALMGPDITKWRWGSLHIAKFRPTTAPLAGSELLSRLQVGPRAIGGSGSTPMATSYSGGDLGVAAGASVRMVLDVGAWDNSVAINTPGQSGDLSSPHYRDLFPIWAAGGYVPLVYSRAAVAQNAEMVTEFVP